MNLVPIFTPFTRAALIAAVALSAAACGDNIKPEVAATVDAVKSTAWV